MKKIGLILLMVACATVLAISSAFAAGVIDTPHDVTSILALTAQGTCSVCHIPHKATGDRLWAAAQSSQGNFFDQRGEVGVLCSSCHVTDGAYAGNLTHAAWAEDYVYSPMSHGVVVDEYCFTPYTGTQDDVDLSGLPYATADDPIDQGAATNTIQCTSCHNVHDNAANRPFLRVNIRDLCIRCHFDRAYDTTLGWQNGVNAGDLDDWDGGLGLANLGSHPVGTNIDAEMSSGIAPDDYDSPIIVWTTWMQLFVDADGDTDRTAGDEYPAGGGHWNLGRHVADLTDQVPGDGQVGGVVCVSCHAIHGVQDDTDPTIDQIQADGYGVDHSLNPNANLLARPQSAGSSRMSMTQANGAASDPETDGANNLCEACHLGGSKTAIGSIAAFMLVENDPVATTYVPSGTPGWFPNPGATWYTHPIDDAYPGNNTDLVTDYVTVLNWPSKDGADTGATPICESCHVPHPYRASTSQRDDILAGAGEYILRAPTVSICGDCHTAGVTVVDHHPVSEAGVTPMTFLQGVPLITSWTTGEPGVDNRIGDGDAAGILQCGDCHNGTGAHNWSGSGQVGLDPDWWPVNNGRTEADDILTELALSAGTSAVCELCHYTMRDGTIDLVNPGSPTHASGSDWDTDKYGQGDYEKHGDGTHFLGNVNVGQGATIIWTDGWLGPFPGALFDATTESWRNTNATKAYTGWSRWGTATAGDHLVCESCHELEPDKNEPNSKLLLYWFAEDFDNAAQAGDNDETSFFCEGCHSLNGPDGTHAMSGDTVSRTNMVLINDAASNSFELLRATLIGTGTPDITPAGAPGTSTFPGDVGSHLMNCDSCHQVHDANSQSMTYILEAPDPNVGEGSDTGLYDRGIPNHGAPYSGGYPHPQSNLTGIDGFPELNYTGFCDQCHWYTYDNRPQLS